MSMISAAFDDLAQFDMQLSSSNAYFVVSHHVSADCYQSMKISTSSLSRQLVKSINGIKSAATTTSSDFALSGHDHDIYVSAFYQNKITHGNKADVASITDITHSRPSVQMAVSAIDSSIMPDVFANTSAWMPKLGTVQLISVNDLDMLSAQFTWNNPKFIGWVPANNNATYAINQFMLSNDIPVVFQTNGNVFRVPSLNDFFETNDNANSNAYVLQNGKSALIPHTHQIQSSGRQSFTFNAVSVENETAVSAMLVNMLNGKLTTNYGTPNVQIKHTVDGFSSNIDTAYYMHCGKNYENNYPIYLEYQMNLDNLQMDSIANVEQDGTDDISYPPHNLMPAIVFVGPSKYSDLSQYVVDEI